MAPRRGQGDERWGRPVQQDPEGRSGQDRPPVEPDAVVALPDAGDALRLLGGFALRRGGVDLELAPTEQRLLALLALRGPLGRGRAAGRLWPDADEARAAAAMRTVLWRLRRLDGRLVLATGDTLRLDASLPVDVSSLTAMARTQPAVTAAQVPTGELLPEMDDDWVVEERPRLLDLQVHVLEEAGERLRERGQHAAALECAHAVLRLDALRETAHRLVLRVHLDEGNVAQAVRWYDAYEQLLRAELGLRPSPLIRSLLPRSPEDGPR